MNEVKTRVADGTNCSKQLKFGVERILSDDISSRKTGEKFGKGRPCTTKCVRQVNQSFDCRSLVIYTACSMLSCVSKDVLRPYPVQLSTVRCPCPGGCVRCEALRICPSFPYGQTSIPGGYGIISHGNATIETYSSVYRPAPLRPVPRGNSFHNYTCTHTKQA